MLSSLPSLHAQIGQSGTATFQLKAPEPNPKYGGTLRYGILSAPAHFDVHQSGTVSNMAAQGPMYDNLIRRHPLDCQTIIPDLAQSWEVAPDGKTYTFFLRQGVQFHDGADFTADDVHATFSRLIFPPKGFSSERPHANKQLLRDLRCRTLGYGVVGQIKGESTLSAREVSQKCWREHCAKTSLHQPYGVSQPKSG
jgi:ABC-type transport system substrate-binding protein